MKYSPHYEILHSLLNEDPRGLVLDWSIESTIESKLLIVNFNANEA